MDSLVVPSKEELCRISEVQEERETQHRRSREIQRRSIEASMMAPSSTDKPPEHRHHHSLSARPKVGQSLDDMLRHKAAIVIQRHYRGYRARRQMKGLSIDSNTRWIHAIREAQYRELTRPRARSELEEDSHGPGLDVTFDGSAPQTGLSPARKKWRKVAMIAKHAGLDQDSSDSDSDSESSSSDSSRESRSAEEKAAARKLKEEAKARRRKDARTMGLQYFLEMVDLKHRYGSNLRTYHEVWQQSPTKESFFYWLDYGEGRYIDITGCPRERLDREQVRYLSREERQYYLVKVDSEGRLCWAKNRIRIDTTEKWKDSIHGIVPADDPTPAFHPITNGGTRLLADSSTVTGGSADDASQSELEAAQAAKYATSEFDEAKGMHKIGHMSASTILDKLLRKSVKKNTWIFVTDTSFRLYVGIKASGAFQHSSFLQGSRISAAGLIKIKNGRLASLSPLSGHYRPPASNFRAFVRSLREEGVDMSHVSISKSYAVLVGLEVYMKTRQKGKEMMKKILHSKDRIIAPEEYRKREEARSDKSKSAELERKFLEKQERELEENKVTVQLMQKLNITPREPSGQKGDDRTETATAGTGEPAR